MKRIREQQDLRDLEEKRRREEEQAKIDWAKKVESLQHMLMKRKYEQDVEN